MNRRQRRQIEKEYARMYKHMGIKKNVAKTQAKATVDTYYMGETFKAGQMAKLNYESIIRHPDFNNQKEEFQQWIHDHKDLILTVSAVRDGGMQVQFEEDEQEPEDRYWHNVLTLIPVASAEIKLEDGTTKRVPLEGIADVNDPKLSEKINDALNEDTSVKANSQEDATTEITEVAEECVKEEK